MIFSFCKDFNKYIWTLLIFIGTCYSLQSQSWVSEVSQAGFILKKVVSDTTVPSGQSFSYTIYYTIPAGATNVNIMDNIPPSLIFQGYSVNAACGTPTVSAPAVNAMGGLLSVSWASVPSGCSGSFTITVAFPNGVTCPGAMARNNACILATLNQKNYEFCTNYLVTTATASNPWHINKYPYGLAYIGGNCQWATGNDTITYQVCVYKNVGTTGQLNLVNAVVTDTLPTGAVLVSSTCGATQSGNVITWNVGNMSALPAYNSACCNFQIYYPLAQFPNGTNITNKATLTGYLGPANYCDSVSTNASTCVTKLTYQSATLSKWAYTNGQPGCAGQYLIYICNNGTTNLPVVALDSVPSSLTSISLGNVWPNTITASLSGNIVSINGSLATGQCGYVYVNFTIPSNATIGSTITNCVHLTSIQPSVSACNTFTVATPAPQACLWKEVCQAQTSYTPGSIFRYRLRVQNIGGQALNGVTLTDVLNSNLEYVGNPSYYIANTWSITNCKPNPTPSEQWAGVNLSYNSGTNTVSAVLPSIAAVCQNIFYSNCGMYGTGGVPYYYIEFDVKVRDTAALGNVPNQFSLSGGTLNTAVETSNTAMVLVTGVVGFNLQKDVKKPNDVAYTNTVTTTAGSLINYRLKLNSSGTAALTHVTFADLLPRNVSPSDQLILAPCGNRSSQFDVSYASVLGTPTPNPVFPYNNNTVLLANVNNLSPSGIPGNSFTVGCGTNGTWASGLGAGDKNMSIYFGPTAVGLTGAEYKFAAQISNTAQVNELACNTFAASAWTKHLIQSSILNYQRAGELESPKTCITIKKADEPTSCLKDAKYDIICKGVDPSTGAVYYSFSMNASSCTPSVLVLSSPDVSFVTSSYSLTSSPWTINGAFSHTSTNNPITIYYTLQCNGVVCRDSVKLDLPQCGDPNDPTDPKDCCKEFKKQFMEPKLTWNSGTGFVGLTSFMAVGPNPIKEFNATIVSAQLRRVCKNTASAWTRIFGDIVSGSVVVAPGNGPQLITPFSREANWGPDSCVNWQKAAQLKLNMLFPPFSGSFLCRDTLRFSIKYTFTDCNCITCDTTINYTIVRRGKWLPWDIAAETHIRFNPSVNNKLHQKAPNKTSLEMSNFNNGKFWVISPDDPSNDVVIRGLEFTSKEVKITDLSSNDANGIVEGDVAFISTEIKAGDTKDINLKFDNKDDNHKFVVNVRYLYTMEGVDEAMFSEPVSYLAYVQGEGGDIVGINNEVDMKIRTYSIYLHNQNEYKENISSLALKTVESQKIIAVGPPMDDNEGVRLFPLKQEDGSFIIALDGKGEPVLYNDKVVPIYLTISGINDKDPSLDFTTFDDMNNIISSGTVQLSNPIAKVQDSEDSPTSTISVFPNPANNLITLSINVLDDIRNATITIRDLRGKVVQEIANNNDLNIGTHIYNVNINKIPNGIYFIELNNGNLTINEKLIIQK
ncbi:MAG TPA: T9SS type A sorting domain-containing protein [Candidatus Kapabacteria bacterium]|nr:T9SS type A sorting domain-containing protein [Candidatus Kapabacteria bacterium]